MSRAPRVVVPGVPHHVVLRGNNRRRLFSYDCDYSRFVYFMACARRRAQCLVHAAALMPNYVHLILTPAQRLDLPCFIKYVAQRYAQSRNIDRCSSGRLFEERYFSDVIDSDRQLAVATAYVDLNPVRAGLVREAQRYKWSTYRLHAHLPEMGRRSRTGIPAAMWTPSAWYLALGSDGESRGDGYRRWIAECLARDEALQNVAREMPPELPILGDSRRFERPDRSRAL